MLPDVEVLARRWAINDTEISALINTRCSTRLPKNPTFPYLTVFRVGGQPERLEEPVIDQALIQWDCYAGKGNNAPKYSEASELMRTLVDSAERFEGGSVGGLGVILGFQTNNVIRQEEPSTGWARYTVDMLIQTREL